MKTRWIIEGAWRRRIVSEEEEGRLDEVEIVEELSLIHI